MNKKIFLFWIISVILILIFIILGGFWFYDGYLLKNNTGAFKSRPEVSKLTESPEKKEILKKDNLYSIKNKAQDEILFAKAQMSKAEQIFQEIKNIDEEISLKFGGYDGMHESRVITPSEYIISKKGQAEVSADKIFLAESENPSTKNSAFAYLSIPVKKEDDEMQINYKFTDKGDGDQMGVWINDEMVTVITGNLLEENKDESTNFYFGDYNGEGSQLVAFALHAYGEVSAKVEIYNIKIISIKKNIYLEMQNTLKGLKSLSEFKIEKNPDINSLKTIGATMPLLEKIDAMSGFFSAEDMIKKSESANKELKYDQAYAYAHYARLITEKMVSGWIPK